MLRICQFANVISVAYKDRMMKKNVLSQQSFSFTSLFSWLVQQNIIVDNDTDVACKYKIRDWWKDQFTFVCGPTKKYASQRGRRIVHQATLNFVTTCFERTYTCNQLTL